MKKLRYWLLLACLLGCQQEEVLFLNYESMELELGETLDISDPRLFLSNATYEIIRETNIEIIQNDQVITEEQLTVGTYALRFTYHDEVKEMELIVQDTTPPEIKAKANQTFVLHEKIGDLESLVSVFDYSEVTIAEINGTIDTSVINNYPITFTVVDNYGNTTNQEIMFTVVDPENCKEVGR